MTCNWRSFYKSLTRRKFIPDEGLRKTELERCLTTFDLTFLGVGSTLGLGIYILVGQIASEDAGPSVCISYFIAALASVFAALCYAEFGARVPKAGSAYVYSYVTVGEFMAFIIGWNLILEYVIGTASVARGYSGYIDSLFNGAIANYMNETLPISIPSLSSYPDFFAFGITVVLTAILAIGVKESSGFNNVCTVLNLLVVSYAVITGSFKADVKNWKLPEKDIPKDPEHDHGKGGFFAFGFHGVMKAAATCFYGYVGFDCIATTGEEAKNPQRSIPIAIVSSLLIVFMAYFSVSTVQTLMWPYYDQSVPAPLPYVFEMVGWPVAKWIISIGALAGLSTSLLGGMFPLPRILYAMAKDGLLFKFFAKTHAKYKTPLLATFVAGIFTGFMAMMFDIKTLANMMSIGTLLAYTLVAVSVLILRYRIQEERIPLAPLLANENQASHSSIMEGTTQFENSCLDSNNMIVTDNPWHIRKLAQNNMTAITASTNTLLASTHHFTYKEIFSQVFNREKIEIQTPISSRVSMFLIVTICMLMIVLDLLLVILEDDLFNCDIGALVTSGGVFLLVCVFVIALATQPSDQQRLSFRVPGVPYIPILSIFVNFYLMLKLPSDTWYRFLYWMIIGFVIYFGYGLWHSNERQKCPAQLPPVCEECVSESEEARTESSPLLGEKS